MASVSPESRQLVPCFFAVLKGDRFSKMADGDEFVDYEEEETKPIVADSKKTKK